MAVASGPRRRSTLPREEARRRYVEMGELAVLEQVRRDARRFDEASIAVGPFARLDAGAVAALEGKTRGAVTNLFGSQSAYQAETMALALNTWEFIERLEYPDPASSPPPTSGWTRSSPASRRAVQRTAPSPR